MAKNCPSCGVSTTNMDQKHCTDCGAALPMLVVPGGTAHGHAPAAHANDDHSAKPKPKERDLGSDVWVLGGCIIMAWLTVDYIHEHGISLGTMAVLLACAYFSYRQVTKG